MPSIKIGDKLCAYEGKKTILQVATENGVEIPSYCYHPGLSIVASCRICLAEVAEKNPKTGQLVKIPKLVPTCQQMASDGMEVYNESEKTKANQQAVMEYLLINHPLDCPVCDQAGECFLQDYSYKYGKSYSRFEETKVKQPKKDIGPHVLLYSDRCIMCSRCVRFTREVSGTAELSVQGRGCKEEIDVFPGKALDNELSANVVDICPVGALLDKDFLFEQRVWFLSETPSIDGITASGDNIYVHHNEGRVWRIKPRANEAVNKWWISDEIRYGWKFVQDESRLKMPIWREFHKQVELEWEKALPIAAKDLQAIVAKGHHVALLVSPMLASEEAYLLAQTVKKLDPGAVFGVGPVPQFGQDKSFPGGYTIYAEKCPNARGVRRALEQGAGLHGRVLDYQGFLDALSHDATGQNIGVVVLTGNFPSSWSTTTLLEAVGERHLLLIDTLPSNLTVKAHVVLPSSPWTEKAGCFENAKGMIQAFEAAVTPLEFSRPEGQIALDLAVALGLGPAKRYDAAAVRAEMGGEFGKVKTPAPRDSREPAMQFVEF
jgi:NADH-quinone oxidoreductase subunit G